MELIPSIDLRGGKCVRLLQGDFARETQYELAPHELLLRYRAMGARWVHVVDLDGPRDGHLANRDTLVALASHSGLPLSGRLFLFLPSSCHLPWPNRLSGSSPVSLIAARRKPANRN